MTPRTDVYRLVRLYCNLEALDSELARLALLCRVRLLEAGVVDRLIAGDASVCGTRNPRAFDKLHQLLLLHFLLRQRSAEALGQLPTTAIESQVIAQLKQHFPGLATV